MTDRSDAVILFVPGKNPKPPVEQHQQLLLRTLREGVRRALTDKSHLAELDAIPLEVCGWNYHFYHQYKDVTRELEWIDALVNTHGPSAEDIREAHAWHRRRARLLYSIGDALPWLIPLIPDEAIKATIKETLLYFHNHNQIASEIREILKQQLRRYFAQGKRVLLIGHSLGSVIAYDTLWEMTHLEGEQHKVDLFLSLGSPLGVNFVQHHLCGFQNKGRERYPHNIRRWVNIASVGDLTALDRCFADDFAEMLELGLCEGIEDHCDQIYNFYRNEQGLNCHRSYGYLVNPAVGKVISDWALLPPSPQN